MKQHGVRPNTRELADRNTPPVVRGIANADVTLWLAISTAVEALSWDEVVLNEVSSERSAYEGLTVRNSRLSRSGAVVTSVTA